MRTYYFAILLKPCFRPYTLGQHVQCLHCTHCMNSKNTHLATKTEHKVPYIWSSCEARQLAWPLQIERQRDGFSPKSTAEMCSNNDKHRLVFMVNRHVFSLPSILWSVNLKVSVSGGSVVENPPAHAGDKVDPWVRKIPWRRKWQPLQCYCLENPTDRGAWWVTVHKVSKSLTWLSS